jgi:hypothetical protein
MVAALFLLAERLHLEQQRSAGLFTCLKQANDDIRNWGGSEDLDTAEFAVIETVAGVLG